MYYWICLTDFKRNPPFELRGHFNSEFSAQSWGDKNLDVDFEIYPIDTRNEARATNYLKIKLEEKHGRSKVGRVRHSKVEV